MQSKTSWPNQKRTSFKLGAIGMVERECGRDQPNPAVVLVTRVSQSPDAKRGLTVPSTTTAGSGDNDAYEVTAARPRPARPRRRGLEISLGVLICEMRDAPALRGLLQWAAPEEDAELDLSGGALFYDVLHNDGANLDARPASRIANLWLIRCIVFNSDGF
ncbi:hypothetical protein EJB05_27904, partial [Eragrostis curvula]